MSDLKQQLREVCAWNRRLAHTNSLLALQLRAHRQEICELKLRLGTVLTERDAINAALGAAIDAALER